MAAIKKATGARLNRSEVVSVRLDPRVHFGAELAAVRQRRTLSSLIECAIDAYLAQVNAGPDGLTVEKVVFEVWSADEADRLVALAFKYPHLLSHDQQVLWDTICAYGPLWKGYWSGNFWTYYPRELTLLRPRLAELWSKLEAVAAGEMQPSELPSLGVEGFIQLNLPFGAGRRGIRQHTFEVTWLTVSEVKSYLERTSKIYGHDDDHEVDDVDNEGPEDLEEPPPRPPRQRRPLRKP